MRDQTVRQIAHVSIGGSRVRIVLSNEYGTRPLTIGAAHIALAGGGSSIVAGSDRPLTFGGRTSFTIPLGAPAVSEPVDRRPGYVLCRQSEGRGASLSADLHRLRGHSTPKWPHCIERPSPAQRVSEQLPVWHPKKKVENFLVRTPLKLIVIEAYPPSTSSLAPVRFRIENALEHKVDRVALLLA